MSFSQFFLILVSILFRSPFIPYTILFLNKLKKKKLIEDISNEPELSSVLKYKI